MKPKYDFGVAAMNWESAKRALRTAFRAIQKGKLQDAFIMYGVASADFHSLEDMTLLSGAPEIEQQLEALDMARYQVGRVIELALADIEKEIKYMPMPGELRDAKSYMSLLEKTGL